MPPTNLITVLTSLGSKFTLVVPNLAERRYRHTQGLNFAAEKVPRFIIFAHNLIFVAQEDHTGSSGVPSHPPPF